MLGRGGYLQAGRYIPTVGKVGADVRCRCVNTATFSHVTHTFDESRAQLPS